jgi:hypothetical protein
MQHNTKSVTALTTKRIRLHEKDDSSDLEDGIHNEGYVHLRSIFRELHQDGVHYTYLSIIGAEKSRCLRCVSHIDLSICIYPLSAICKGRHDAIPSRYPMLAFYSKSKNHYKLSYTYFLMVQSSNHFSSVTPC